MSWLYLREEIELELDTLSKYEEYELDFRILVREIKRSIRRKVYDKNYYTRKFKSDEVYRINRAKVNREWRKRNSDNINSKRREAYKREKERACSGSSVGGS